MAALTTRCFDVFATCAEAVRRGELIKRVSSKDKEFHFQNWFAVRLREAGIQFDPAGRNSYPDFTLVHTAEGYEVKGLGYPGREANYDANSRVPTGLHNGRQIFYVFGRYPSEGSEPEYPVIDLVVCHGDFLNADHNYVHKNKSFRGFGSYGDILVRDRKMYVAPTPFALTAGTTGQQTLLVPRGYPVDPRFHVVGELLRVEADKLVVGYDFDLKANVLTPRFMPNPDAGKRHHFVALRLRDVGGQVALTTPPPIDLDENGE